MTAYCSDYKVSYMRYVVELQCTHKLKEGREKSG